MVNYNGQILREDTITLLDNRGFLYGDMIRESIRVHRSRIVFWEAHYFRLMSSMRLMRMQIPMNYTMEFLEGEIKRTINAKGNSDFTEIVIYVFRKAGKSAFPEAMGVSFIMTAKAMQAGFETPKESFEITLYKDHKISAGLLSSLNGHGGMAYLLGGIFARENGYDDALLLNTEGQVVGCSSGIIFMLKDLTVFTPAINEGAINGVYRRELIKLCAGLEDYSVEETKLTAFDISKADEVFVLYDITGIQQVTAFRKSEYTSVFSNLLRGMLWDKMESVNSG